VTLADTTGRGIQDAVEWAPFTATKAGGTFHGWVGGIRSTALGANGMRPGLLTDVVSSAGAHTHITYDLAAHCLAPSGEKLPVPTWLATDITTTNDLLAQTLTLHTSYAYDHPVYDDFDAVFAGFAHVTETSDGDVGSPGRIRKTTFATSSCNDA